MSEMADRKIKKLKLNKKALEMLNDNQLQKVSGGGASFWDSGCISLRTACCQERDTGTACGSCI